MTFAVVKPVPRRDFFSFCTTLRPIELKALGELSHVRHLQKRELVYTTGDLAEEIYSVNRGVVEVIQRIPCESNERLATFYFQGGALRSGQFQQLTGEEAFWQLFLSDDIPGSFSFASGVQPITDCLQSVEINQSPNDMLITAMRHRDEFHNLKKTTPDPNTLLQRLAPSFEWPRDADQELKPLAERIWNYTNDRRFTINELFRQNAVCE